MISTLVTIRITVRIQEFEVRNPDLLDNRKNYQRILMKLYGELGLAYRPTDHIFVTIRIAIQIRESVPDHDPDPGRTGVRRRSVLSTSSFGFMFAF